MKLRAMKYAAQHLHGERFRIGRTLPSTWLRHRLTKGRLMRNLTTLAQRARAQQKYGNTVADDAEGLAREVAVCVRAIL